MAACLKWCLKFLYTISSQSTLDHVRAGKETVIEEVVAAGFRLREEITSLCLKTNYYLIFERL